MAACTLTPLKAQAQSPDLQFDWAGVDAIEADYNPSTLKKVVDLLEPDTLVAAWLQGRQAILAQADNPDLREGLESVERVWNAAWRGPLRVWCILPEGTDDSGQPAIPYGGIRFSPTDPAVRQALETDLRQWLSEMGDVPIQLAMDADSVTLHVGDTHSPAPAAMASEDPLRLHVDFATAYAYIERWMDSADAPLELRRVLKVLHPAGLESLTLTEGFRGEAWGNQLTIQAPAPRRGLAMLLDPPPLEDADFSTVPTDAPMVLAMGFDLNEFFSLIREAVHAADPEAGRQFEEAVANVNQMLGVDFEADLIQGLGTGHVIFQDPAIAGRSGLGLLWTTRLAKPDQFAAALTTAQNIANGLIAAQTHDSPLSVQIHTLERDGVELHTMALPGIAPTWSVFEGRLHVGLYPQSILAATDRRQATQSILDVPAFAKLHTVAGDHSMTGLSYVDLPATAPGSYQTFLMMEHLATGLGAMASGESFPAVLPPFRRFEPHLAPVSSVSWMDDTGYQSQGSTPFPGAMLLASQGASPAAMLPMIMGGLGAAVEAFQISQYDSDDYVYGNDVAMNWDEGMDIDADMAWQDPDVATLASLTAMIHLYAQEHEDARPTRLSEVTAGFASDVPKVLSEFDADAFPANLVGGSPEAIAQWMDGTTSFVLVPGPALNDPSVDPATAPVIFRNPNIMPVEDWSPLPVGYADGHVETITSLDVLAQQIRDASNIELDELLEGLSTPSHD